MPLRRTHYSTKWEEEYCFIKKHDEFNAKCSVCNVTFRIDCSGIAQVKSHQKSKKHTDIEDIRNGATSQRVFTVDHANNHASTLRKEKYILTAEEKVLKAETLYALKCCMSNFSFASANDTGELFKEMFPDSKIAQNYKMAETKVKYVLQFGIAPYMKEALKKDFQGTPFTFKFDETTTSQIKKQYDGYVQYWSKNKNQIVGGAYCGSLFLGHCNAEQLKDHFVEFGNDMDWNSKLLLHIGMDGPNVNLSFQKKLLQQLHDDNTTMLDLGTCSLHPVHTGFHKALLHLSIDLDQFANDLHFFFKYSSARREDFLAVDDITDVTANHMLRHVSSRWLSLKKVLIRVLEQWKNLCTYFLITLPKEKNFGKAIASTDRYRRIIGNLRDPATEVCLSFVIFIAEECESFLVRFQSHDPLIHLLYPKMSELLLNIMSKFLKKPLLYQDEACTTVKEGRDLIEIDCSKFENQKSNVEIGKHARNAILKLPIAKQKLLMLEYKKFYTVIASYLQQKLPLNSSVLRDVQFLHPLKRLESTSRSAISRLAMKFGEVLQGQLKEVFQIQGDRQTKEHLCDVISHQWQMYQAENIPESFYLLSEDIARKRCSTSCNKEESEDYEVMAKFVRIDSFWAKIGAMEDLDGNKKYEQLFSLVKCCLTLSHGNAIPERGFSLNKAVLQNKSSLSEETIVSLRLVKDSLISAGGVTHFPINHALLMYVKDSYKKYELHMKMSEKIKEDARNAAERSNKMKEEAKMALKRKSELDEKIATIEEEIENQKSFLAVAEHLLEEGHKKLQKAMTGHRHMPIDKQKIQEANGMLGMGIERQREIKKALEELENKIKRNC